MNVTQCTESTALLSCQEAFMRMLHQTTCAYVSSQKIAWLSITILLCHPRIIISVVL